MNIEQNDQVYEQPKKSGKGLFACGGIGCILLLLFCGGGIGLMAYIFIPMGLVVQEAQTLSIEHPAVIEVLGEPITPTQPQVESQTQDPIVMNWKMPISGPNGEATVRFSMELKGTKMEKIAHTVEFADGQEIDLMADGGGFELDIEDGGE